MYPTQVTWKAKFKCYAIILHLDRSITGDPQTSTGDDNEVTGDGLLGKGVQKRKMEIFLDLPIGVAPPPFIGTFFHPFFSPHNNLTQGLFLQILILQIHVTALENSK